MSGESPQCTVIRLIIQLVKGFPMNIRDIQDFEFIKKIGKGAFGEVWLANDLRTGKSVAVKELYTKHVSNREVYALFREVRMLAQLHERFLLPFVGFTVDPPYSIITEFMENGCLIDYIDKTKRNVALSGTHKTIIAVCIAWALLALGVHHVAHRDVKCQNILLDSRWLPNLSDFGVSRIVPKDRRMSTGTGTVTHMAPEVMKKGEPYGTECDIFSYGIVLYEMLEEKRAWAGYRKDTLKEIVLEGKRPAFVTKKSKLPKGLVDLIEECWDQDPAKRPAPKTIINRFRNGVAYFPGTDVEQVKEFVTTLIDQIEEHNLKRQEEREDIGHMTPRAEQIVARLEEKLAKALAGSEASETDTEVVTQRLLLANGKDPKEALSNSEEFESALKYLTGIVTVPQFEEFYELTNEFLKEDVGVALPVMRAYLALAKRDAAFIEELNKVHFATRLVLVEPQMRQLTFEYVEYLFFNAPQQIHPDMYRAISAFIVNEPSAALVSFSFYASKYDEIDEPLQLLDLLIRFARVFLDQPAGVKYIDIMHYLLTEKPTFKQKRMATLRPILCAFIKSKVPKVTQEAICAVCSLYDSEFHLPISTLCDTLKRNQQAVGLILSLFLRMKSLPESKTFVRLLGTKTLIFDKAIVVLQKYASESPERAEHVAFRQRWMTSHSMEAFRLFLFLFAHPNLREPLTRAETFIRFMTYWAKSKKPSVIGAFGAIFSNCAMDQLMVNDLAHAGFFTNFLQSAEAIDKSKREVMHEIMVSLDHIVRAGYCADLQKFCPFLASFLPMQNDLSMDAINVFVAFSCHPPLAKIFKNTELVSYFMRLKSRVVLKNRAQLFIDNVSQEDQ